MQFDKVFYWFMIVSEKGETQAKEAWTPVSVLSLAHLI